MVGRRPLLSVTPCGKPVDTCRLSDINAPHVVIIGGEMLWGWVHSF